MSADDVALAGDEAAGPVAAASEDEASVTVSGATARRSKVVESVLMAFVATTGRLKDETVLVPYVDCDVAWYEGGEDEEPRQLAITLTLDNVAFLFEASAIAFAELIPILNSVSAGEVRPPADRVDFTKTCLARTIKQLNTALDSLPDVLDGG